MNEWNPMLGPDWGPCLGDEFKEPYWAALQEFLEKEPSHQVFPPRDEVFAAFHLTPPDKIKAVIIGQDPYPSVGEAHGLAFSVRCGVKKPRTLRVIHQELHDDLKLPIPRHGNLEAWAREGVLLLNATLTVREGKRGSHRRKGWERFTNEAIRCVNDKIERVVFLLWGKVAQEKCGLINTARHTVICSTHPSPMAAYKGCNPFFGSAPFSRANRALRAAGREEIDWDLTKDCSS